MEIEISNKIRIKNAPDSLKSILLEHLKISNPKYVSAVNMGYSTWGIDPYIYNFNIFPDNSFVIPRGCRVRLLDLIKTMGLKCNIKDSRTIFPFIFGIDSTVIKYRPYQYKAVVDLISNGPEGLLVAPPGSGKTVIGISLVPLLGQPAMWLTHTDRLAKQTLERIHSFLPCLKNEDVGYIGASKWNVGKIITVAMVQTLIKRPIELFKLRNEFGLVILDECHHCAATTFLNVVSQLNPYYLYGLTATPYRRDKLEALMFQTLGEKSVTITMKEVEKAGGIIIPTIKYKAIRSKHITGVSIQTILKDYIVNNNKRNGIIVGDILKEAMAGNFCIVISDRKAHCEILYELISTSWKKTGIATGNYSKKYVDEQVSRFYNNEITVLVTTFALLGEGFDVDFLNRAFITMPFRAEGKAEQLIGRVQRTAKGKTDAIVYDYVDTDVGMLRSQFYTASGKDCRYRVYERLGVNIEPY